MWKKYNKQRRPEVGDWVRGIGSLDSMATEMIGDAWLDTPVQWIPFFEYFSCDVPGCTEKGPKHTVHTCKRCQAVSYDGSDQCDRETGHPGTHMCTSALSGGSRSWSDPAQAPTWRKYTPERPPRVGDVVRSGTGLWNGTKGVKRACPDGCCAIFETGGFENGSMLEYRDDAPDTTHPDLTKPPASIREAASQMYRRDMELEREQADKSQALRIEKLSRALFNLRMREEATKCADMRMRAGYPYKIDLHRVEVVLYIMWTKTKLDVRAECEAEAKRIVEELRR